jgi:hypothetical protein
VAVACSFDASGSGIGVSASLGSGSTGETTTQTPDAPETSVGDSTTTSEETIGETTSGELSTWDSAEPTTGLACERLDTTACLFDDDLLVRYFLDEAELGVEPIAEVLDAAPDPLSLTLVTGTAGPTYTSTQCNWGLQWSAAEQDGVAATPVPGTKLEQLEGRTAATIEVVATVQNVTDWHSRFMHIGAGIEGGRFSLTATHLTTVSFRWHGETTFSWAVDDLSQHDRVVLHAVLNTDAADPAERLILYVNGQPQPPPGWVVNQGAAITLSSNRRFAIGNRDTGGRSFEGTLFYVALYTRALTPGAVARHAQILGLDDDAP